MCHFDATTTEGSDTSSPRDPGGLMFVSRTPSGKQQTKVHKRMMKTTPEKAEMGI